MATAAHLEQLMRTLATDATQSNRFALYRALMAAELVVPLLPGNPERPGGLPLADDLAQEEGSTAAAPLFAVFTDDVGLSRWRDGGGPRARVYGYLLFPLLAEAKCAALKINPKGHVGGLLYGHEVETIAGATRKVGAQG
ncbi:MAG: SseB family protein [Myxococcales bacterium]|nr:SseB family protein [Myxococcales bacterium]